MKIVIVGLGKYYKKFENDIDYSNVVALIDLQLQGQIIHGFPVQSYEILRNIQCDYIVVFSVLYHQEIVQALMNDYRIPKRKIIIWSELKSYTEGSRAIAVEHLIDRSITIIKAKQFTSILELGMRVAENGILNIQDSRVNLSAQTRLDCYNYKNNKTYPLFNNLYNHIYNASIHDHHDLAVLMYVRDLSISDCENIIEETYPFSRYVLINISDCGKSDEELWTWITYEYERWGHVSRFFDETSRLVLIDKEHKSAGLDLNIYVVTHKEFTPPDNDIYIPIQAGRALNDALGYLSDNDGDNISCLNPLINECTAIYWIWKHTKSEYVGINHYRRYFLKDEINHFDNIIDEEAVNRILKTYDFILPCSYHEFPGSLKEGLLDGVDKDAVEKGISLVRGIIATRHKGYLDAFDYIFEGNTFYMCNMFITRRELFNEYCKWFFDIIIEAAQKIDVSQYDSYSKRIIGFMAERLLTVWLLKTPYKIKELPIIVTE